MTFAFFIHFLTILFFFGIFFLAVYQKFILFMQRPMGTKLSSEKVEHEDIPVIAIFPEPNTINMRKDNTFFLN